MRNIYTDMVRYKRYEKNTDIQQLIYYKLENCFYLFRKNGCGFNPNEVINS